LGVLIEIYPHPKKGDTPKGGFMATTDLEARNAKPKEKPYKVAFGEGLYLLVNPNGKKYWRLKYRFAGKEKALALGV
jgi:hypothetical protein